MWSRMRSVLLPMAVVVLGGCSGGGSGSGRPAVVPVKVQVTYKGQPLVGATVTMTNTAANSSGIGTTGADGSCSLTTFNPGDGVVPGSQVVAIRKVEVIDRSKPGVDYGATNETPPPPEERWHTPRRYADAVKSGLTAEVTAGGKNTFVFELKD